MLNFNNLLLILWILYSWLFLLKALYWKRSIFFSKKVYVCCFSIHKSKHVTDLCEDVACQNGGICKLKEGKPFCQCDIEYLGEYCEKREYPFKSNNPLKILLCY